MYQSMCNETIPDVAEKCPNGGATISEINKQTTMFTSQEESVKGDNPSTNSSTIMPWLVVIGLAIASLASLALKYMSISVKLIVGSSDTTYTGYYLTKCLGGTAKLSGIMVIILIILNVITIITAITGMVMPAYHSKPLKMVLLFETISYLIVTAIPYFHISSLLEEFDSPFANTSIGIGCYLNIGIALLMAITCLGSLSKR